jgi:dynein assembly factor with WDR repeat domains 1
MDDDFYELKKLDRILARFYPPGIILELSDDEDNIETKAIDLLNLTENSDIPYLIQQIIEKEPIAKKHISQLKTVIESKKKNIFYIIL